MKIAIPVLMDKITLNSAYGRTELFAVVDTDTRETTYLDNTQAANAEGGAGIAASQLLADNNVDAALAPLVGRNAADVLKAAGIPLYYAPENTVDETVDAFIAGELKLMTDDEIHAGFHWGGGN